MVYDVFRFGVCDLVSLTPTLFCRTPMVPYTRYGTTTQRVYHTSISWSPLTNYEEVQCGNRTASTITTRKWWMISGEKFHRNNDWINNRIKPQWVVWFLWICIDEQHCENWNLGCVTFEGTNKKALQYYTTTYMYNNVDSSKMWRWEPLLTSHSQLGPVF